MYIKLQFNSHLFILRFPFLSYRVSIYSFHLFLISSGSVNSFPVSSFIASLVQLVVFFLVNCPTLAYSKSDRALRSNSSNSLHSFSTIFLLLDLFLFSIRYLGADMFFCLPLYSCSSTSFSLASSPLWLSLSMVFWQLFLSSILHFLQHFSLLPLLNSPISPLLFPV